MTKATLEYARAAIRNRPPALTLEQRRRRRRRWVMLAKILLTLSFSFVGLLYVTYVGNTRWRVWWQQGVVLPASAKHLKCSGWIDPLVRLDGDATAEFVISPADLPAFLMQFQQAVTNGTSAGYSIARKPQSPPSAPNGETWGPSPTGRDYYGLEWKTTGEGVVIKLYTDWNQRPRPWVRTVAARVRSNS